MCGRYVLRSSAPDLARMLGVEEPPEITPSYNIAPSREVPVCRARRDQRRELIAMRWGLVPRWMKDPRQGSRMINARAETVAEKPAFRAALRHRRCLVPADGFYEWQARPGGKQPHYIARRDQAPFGFAGLWEHWEDGGGPGVVSFTIVTAPASGSLAAIHPRMPVILPPSDFGRWLNPTETDAAAVLPLLARDPIDEMVAIPVSPLVNHPRNDDPRCIAPLAARDEG